MTISDIALLVLVAVTAYYARATSKIARATEKSVVATEGMSQQVELDRIYQLRPIVVPLSEETIRCGSTDDIGDRSQLKVDGIVKVKNIGTGPAINLKVEGIFKGVRASGILAGLGSGDEQDVPVSGNISNTSEPWVTLTYSSIRGKRFRIMSTLTSGQLQITAMEFGEPLEKYEFS